MATELSVIDLNAESAEHEADMHALNNRFAVETSWLETDEWARLTGMARVARLCLSGDAAAGFLIAFDETADYDSANYQWFKVRETGFLYIDRVITHEEHQRKGVASRLYADLIDQARAGGFATIVCEVNQDPPNPASDAFHTRLGFKEVGQAQLVSGKTVSYLKLAVLSAAP